MGKVISVRVGNDQEKLLTKFAETEGMSVSDFIRETVFDKIETEMDIKILDERKQIAKNNEYEGRSLEEVIKNLDL